LLVAFLFFLLYLGAITIDMDSQKDYHLGLLYLVHLLMSADGVIDETENNALLRIKSKENISDKILEEFKKEIASKKDREIYQEGIELINRCSDDKKLDAFVHLYKMSEVDGTIHVKEVRLLLYSIKMAKIEFSDVVARASQLKNY
jgi:uncharacterized tellurite resistance protein B-like protein